MKIYIGIKETTTKFSATVIEKHKFNQYERPISIKSIGINKIVVTNKVLLGKKSFKFFIGCKDAKKLDIYVYFSKKWVHIEETLMKLSICLFYKRWWVIRKMYWNLEIIKNSI